MFFAYEKRKYADYVSRHKEYLQFGDATDLKHFKDNSVDVVISHKMMVYLSNESQKKVVRESFRVVKPGGVVRHSITVGFSLTDFGKKSELEQNARFRLGLRYLMEDWVEAVLGDGAPYSLIVRIGGTQIRIKPKAKEHLKEILANLTAAQTRNMKFSDYKQRFLGKHNILTIQLLLYKKP